MHHAARDRSRRRPGRRPRRGRADGWRTAPPCRRAPARAITAESASTPSGSRPANGSSSTSATGSCTSAAASCTRCWLPCESASSRASPRSWSPSRASQRSTPAAARAAIQPRQAREVLELRPDPHVRIQAALLRHVAEAQTRLAVDRRAVPAHLATVGLDEPEDAAHRRRLARAVRAQQPHHAARAHRQAAAVERHDVAVALAQADDLEPEAPKRRGTVRPALPLASRRSVAVSSPARVSGGPSGRYARVDPPETGVRRRSRQG